MNIKLSKKFFVALYLIVFTYLTFDFFVEFPDFPVSVWLEKVIHAASALFLMLGCMGFGCALMNILDTSMDFDNENAPFAYVLGIGSLIFFVFTLGILNLLYPVFFWMYASAGALLLFRMRGRFKLNFTGRGLSQISLLFIIPVVSAAFLMFLSCFAPPTYYDSVVYHLAIPGLYLQEHSIYNITANLYSAFPQNVEMIFTAALGLGGTDAVRLMSFSFFIMVSLMLFNFCRKYTGVNGSFFALFVFATIPSVMLMFSSAYIEPGSTLFIVCSVTVFIYWVKEKRKGLLLLSGIASGLAFGAKYNGAIVPVVLSALIFVEIVFIRKTGIKDFFKKWAVFSLPVLLLSLPWLIKNMIFLGNPVFPFFYKLFGWGGIQWTQATAEGYFRMLVSYGVQSNFFKELILLPFKIVNESGRFAGGADILGGIGWAFIVLGLPSIMFVRSKDRAYKYLLVYLAMHLGIWFSTGQVLRFLMVLLPFFSFLVAYGLGEIYKKYGRAVKVLITVIVVSFLMSNVFLLSSVNSIVEPYDVAMGLEDRDTYLVRKYGDYYRALHYVNNNLSGADKVYILGDQAGFYCTVPYVLSFAFAPERLVSWANNSNNCADFLEKFKSEKITHILYNRREAARLDKSYGILSFSSEGKKIWEDAQEMMKKIEIGKTTLYEIPD